MLIGAGALGAADEVIEVADLLGAALPRRCSGKLRCPMTLPVRDRLDRVARDEAELDHDDASATRS